MNKVNAAREMGFVSSRQYGALDTLVMGCRDAGNVYRSASKIVSNPEHRKLLLALSRRRSSFVEDIKLLSGRDGLPWTGSPFRALRWVLRWFASIHGAHDGDTFRGCAKAEARVLRLYALALRREWPLEVRDILGEQRREMETTYDQMRTLRGLH